MFYLKAFVNSLYNLPWLRRQANNGKGAANYVVLLILFVSIVSSIFFSYKIPHELRMLRDEAATYVPNFTATFDNGNLQVTELEQPFVYEDKDFRLAIDTTDAEDFDTEAFLADKETGYLLITSSSVHLFDIDKGKETIQNFTEIPNVSFSKHTAIDWTDNVLDKVVTFFVIILLLTFIGLAIFKLVHLLVIALLAWFVSNIIRKEDLKFSQIFTMGLFAITGPSVLVLVLRMFSMNVYLLYSLVLMVVMILLILQKEEKTPEMAEKTKVEAVPEVE